MEDWTLPKKHSDGSFENFQRYLFAHWPWRLTAHLSGDLTARRSLRHKSLREMAIFLALWSIPFWIDPVMALWLWVLPHWIASCVRDGCGHVRPAFGMCREDSRQTGKSLHRICLELFQSHNVQYRFPPRAPSQGPLVGTPGTSHAPKAGNDRWRNARGSVR